MPYKPFLDAQDFYQIHDVIAKINEEIGGVRDMHRIFQLFVMKHAAGKDEKRLSFP